MESVVLQYAVLGESEGLAVNDAVEKNDARVETRLDAVLVLGAALGP